MSFIVKGVDLPKGCYECPIAKSYLDCLMKRQYVCPIGHTDDCPLIQIPKYHGKIVDLDDLVVKHWDGNFMIIDNEAYDNAVAILEAEEET